MKVLLLSAANNIHTIRWANGLTLKGLEVQVCSLHDVDHDNEKFLPQIKIHIFKSRPPQGYFLAVRELKNIVQGFQPDILNVHYATGYGNLARLASFQPYLLSVWGSDVYDFPKKSVLHKGLLKKNLMAATAIASTSHCMANEVLKTIQSKRIFITPFGIDCSLFKTEKKIVNDGATIVVGTVKTLEEKYGVDTLIRAFALVKNDPDCPKIKLEIIGRGTELDSLRRLVADLNIQEYVKFKGFIEYKILPEHLKHFNIYVALSRSESFGVAILEASACKLPVVVSDADGLKEVTIDNHTGFIVPKDNVEQAAEQLLLLIKDRALRESMGQAGRQHVLDNYTWEHSLDIMIQTYQDTIDLYAKS